MGGLGKTWRIGAWMTKAVGIALLLGISIMGCKLERPEHCVKWKTERKVTWFYDEDGKARSKMETVKSCEEWRR